MTKTNWSLKGMNWDPKGIKWDSLQKIDFTKIDWMTGMFLFVILLNLLSLIINAVAGNLFWVGIAVIIISANIFALENHYKNR